MDAVNMLVCNQKGGVGKSMVADELAFSFARSGIPFSFVDMDGQGGTLHGTVEVPGAAAAVIDTPGALQEELRQWMEAADIIVIPTRPSTRDIAPLQRMLTAAEQTDAKVIAAVNFWTRYRASADFCSWLQDAEPKLQFCRIPQSEMFLQAAAAGMSVVEYARRSRAAGAVLDLCNAVRAAAGFAPEVI